MDNGQLTTKAMENPDSHSQLSTVNCQLALGLLDKAIRERNDENGIGGATKVAAEMGISDSLVSQLRSKVYPKPEKKFYPLIIELYGKETVKCPVIGIEIALTRCRRERERPYSSANPTRVELSGTCPTCQHNPLRDPKRGN